MFDWFRFCACQMPQRQMDKLFCRIIALGLTEDEEVEMVQRALSTPDETP